MEKIRMMQERGRIAADQNPWDTEFKREKADKGTTGEGLVDKAKSFSF
jgi:hypothetical protein